MTLLKYGEVSSGKVSKLLGISRLEVLELISKNSQFSILNSQLFSA